MAETIPCNMKVGHAPVGNGHCGKPAMAFYVVSGKVGRDGEPFLVALCHQHAGVIPQQWRASGWKYAKIRKKEWTAFWVHDV